MCLAILTPHLPGAHRPSSQCDLHLLYERRQYRQRQIPKPTADSAIRPTLRGQPVTARVSYSIEGSLPYRAMKEAKAVAAGGGHDKSGPHTANTKGSSARSWLPALLVTAPVSTL